MTFYLSCVLDLADGDASPPRHTPHPRRSCSWTSTAELGSLPILSLNESTSLFRGAVPGGLISCDVVSRVA